MMRESPTRRRWFQFGLATMLGVVAVSAVFWASVRRDLMAVRERRNVRETAERVWVADEYDSLQRTIYFPNLPAAPSISYWRRLLGDEAVLFLLLRPKTTDGELERAKAIFPEAIVGRREIKRRPYSPRKHTSTASAY